MKKRETILLLTSTGGSGHLKAGEAKKAQLRRENPDLDIQVKEVNTDLFGFFLGPFLITLWNRAQKQGHTHLLEIYAKLERAHEVVSFIPVFCAFLPVCNGKTTAASSTCSRTTPSPSSKRSASTISCIENNSTSSGISSSSLPRRLPTTFDRFAAFPGKIENSLS